MVTDNVCTTFFCRSVLDAAMHTGPIVLITCAIISCLDYSDFNVLAIIYLPCLLLKFLSA